MVTKGLIARLEAKAGKEDEVAAFLRDALPIVQGEQQTVAWLALRASESSFAIVDVFPDEAGTSSAPRRRGRRSPDRSSRRAPRRAARDRARRRARGEAAVGS